MLCTPQVDQVDEKTWSELLNEFDDASLYQTWSYGATCWGENQLSHLVLEIEGRVAALAQLRLVCTPLMRRGVAHLRWGPVCIRKGESFDPRVYEAMAKALVDEFVRKRRLQLRVVPNVCTEDEQAPLVSSLWLALELTRDESASPYRTFRISLEPSPDILRKQLAQKWRNQLNAAERNNLALLEGTEDALFHRFAQLYDGMMERKQFETSVSVSAFRAMQQRLPEGQKMRITIAMRDEEPIAGVVGTAIGKTGVYLLGATSEAGMKWKASYLLQWQMMLWLRANACQWYDLGGINPETNPGVYHFKKGMGGRDVCGFGRFVRRGDCLSEAAVHGAERLQRLLRRGSRFR